MNQIAMSCTSSSSSSASSKPDKIEEHPPQQHAISVAAVQRKHFTRVIAIRDDIPPIRQRHRSTFMCGIICTDNGSATTLSYLSVKSSDVNRLVRYALQLQTFSLDDLDLAAYIGGTRGSATKQIGRALAYFTDTNGDTKITNHYVLYQIWTQDLSTTYDALPENMQTDDDLMARARAVVVSIAIGHFCLLGATVSYKRIVESTIVEPHLQTTRDVDWCEVKIEEVLTYPASVGMPEAAITHLYPCSEFQEFWPAPVPRSVVAERFKQSTNYIVDAKVETSMQRDLLFLLLVHFEKCNKVLAVSEDADCLHQFLNTTDNEAIRVLAQRINNFFSDEPLIFKNSPLPAAPLMIARQ